MPTYITVAIPYVNAAPHVGYAFELVDADLAARARRRLGDAVRFLGGTDEHSLKNVLAAEAARQPTGAFVTAHAARFAELADRLGVTFDDFIRTSSDPRHAPAVERLWRACAAAGDLYERAYEGAYCVGCEQFYAPADLDHGACPEHRVPATVVRETNWFFRLSRYQDRLTELIERGRLRVEPEPYRNEVLAFLRSGLDDVSVSRTTERARGWGIPVPDDPSQVISVWFDALVSYIGALGYGTGDDAYGRWWVTADERIHVIGKGITRFHAVHWPAFLLSAGEPLPTHVHVHPYLTAAGRKVSKSAGEHVDPHVDPVELVDRYGQDALRWWLAAEPARASDTDVTVERLVARADRDLANGIGNTVRRVTALLDRVDVDRRWIDRVGPVPLPEAVDLPDRVARALAGFDRRGAVRLVLDAIDALNHHIEHAEPWRARHDPAAAAELVPLLAAYHATLRSVVDAARPLVPALAARADPHLDGHADRPLVQPRLAASVGAAVGLPEPPAAASR